MSQYKVGQPVWIKIKTEQAQSTLWLAVIQQIKRTKDRANRYQYEVSLIDKEDSVSIQTLLIKESEIIPFESHKPNQSKADAQLLLLYKRAKDIYDQKCNKKSSLRQYKWINSGIQKPQNMKNFLWSLTENFDLIKLDEQIIEVIKNCGLQRKYASQYNELFFCQMLNFLINQRGVDPVSKIALDDLRKRMKNLILQSIFEAY